MQVALILLVAGLTADPTTQTTKRDEAALRKSYDARVKSLDAPRIGRDYAGAVKNLKSKDVDRQLRGLSTLAATGESEVIPWIVPLLDAPDALVRIHAGLALKNLVSDLALKRRDPAVADRVALLPRGPKDPDLRSLAWVVLRMLKQPDDGNTHAYAATMIRYLELKQFEPELRQLLRSRHFAVSDTARWALGELGFPVDRGLPDE